MSRAKDQGDTIHYQECRGKRDTRATKKCSGGSHPKVAVWHHLSPEAMAKMTNEIREQVKWGWGENQS